METIFKTEFSYVLSSQFPTTAKIAELREKLEKSLEVLNHSLAEANSAIEVIKYWENLMQKKLMMSN
jgi:hypothetical protein